MQVDVSWWMTPPPSARSSNGSCGKPEMGLGQIHEAETERKP